MKVGIIGLGDICQKAYLPIITTREDVELVFCTRNKEKLQQLAKKYKIQSYVNSVEELIALGIDAAFVHTSTDSHAEIVEKLLNNGIHVYVDKPISYNYEDALKLMELSKAKNRVLMVGFNRRHAPIYKRLKETGTSDIVIMEKNRVSLPENTRIFILDDFIHVVDTLRFLMDGEIESLKVNALKKQGFLYNVVITLANKNTTAIGIMNRDNGITEEVVEYMSSGNKLVVKDLMHTSHLRNNSEELIKFKDWDPILYRRGFYGVIDSFLKAVAGTKDVYPAIEDSILTHKICEEIINCISQIEN